MTDGPVMITEIEANNPELKDGDWRSKKFELTLTIPFDIGSTSEIPEIDKEFLQLFIARDDWRDGRYPYKKELMMDGLRSTIKYAVEVMVEEQFRKIYGRQMTQTGDGCSTNTAVLKAGEVSKKLNLYISGDSWKAKVEDKCQD